MKSYDKSKSLSKVKSFGYERIALAFFINVRILFSPNLSSGGNFCEDSSFSLLEEDFLAYSSSSSGSLPVVMKNPAFCSSSLVVV